MAKILLSAVSLLFYHNRWSSSTQLIFAARGLIAKLLSTNINRWLLCSIFYDNLHEVLIYNWYYVFFVNFSFRQLCNFWCKISPIKRFLAHGHSCLSWHFRCFLHVYSFLFWRYWYFFYLSMFLLSFFFTLQ